MPPPWPVTVYLLCVLIPLWRHVGPLFLSLLLLFLIIMFIPLMVRLLAGQFGRVPIVDVLFFPNAAKSSSNGTDDSGSGTAEMLTARLPDCHYSLR